MRALPMELKDVNDYVAQYHRHHQPVYRDKIRFGCLDDDDRLCGVIQMARPVNRVLDDGMTIEVVRCCTNGTQNACSFLYSRAARIAKELGYKRIITYVLESEDGASLKASGWHCEAENVGGGSWHCPSRPRDVVDRQISMFGDSPKYSTEKKKRFIKILN